MSNMQMKFIYPVAELLLTKVNLSKPFCRTFIASCVRQSWDSSDDEQSYKTRPTYNSQRPFYQNDQFRRRDFHHKFESEGRENFNNNNFRFREREFYSPDDKSWSQSGPGQNLKKPDWHTENLTPIVKDFFTNSNKITSQTTEEISKYRNNHSMTMVGSDVPDPIPQFADYDFIAELSKYLSTKAFESPTPIQSQGIPIALSGRDMIGIAKTGSGKTLGYILPCITHIHHQPPVGLREGPIGLVLAPTRELVQQINEVAREVGYFTGTKTVCVFGGASKFTQGKRLAERPSLCIATPGRLLDFLEMRETNLRRCSFLVLDEADRMLDMGFEPQIRKIIGQIRPDRQTLMWSATWPREVQSLASDFLTDPIRLNVGSLDLVANPDIQQQVEVSDSSEKISRLMDRLMSELDDKDAKILIFVETKRTADWLGGFLYRKRFPADAIHGDASQARRDRMMRAFRDGHCRILVATDVASRGLDVDGISLVVNFDFPKTIDTYIHRIGRTARAGKSGKALSFVTPDDHGIIRELTRVLREAKQDVPEELSRLHEFVPNLRKRNSRGRSRW